MHLEGLCVGIAGICDLDVDLDFWGESFGVVVERVGFAVETDGDYNII